MSVTFHLPCLHALPAPRCLWCTEPSEAERCAPFCPPASPTPAPARRKCKRHPPQKYKTVQCRNFAAGRCPYGCKCVFAHGEGDERK